VPNKNVQTDLNSLLIKVCEEQGKSSESKVPQAENFKIQFSHTVLSMTAISDVNVCLD